MKSVLSLALVTSLLLPSLPAAAQPPRQLSTSRLSNWSRVRAIVAGSRISASYVGRRQEHQYFVAATDETLTVLTPERLPRAARKVLVEIAEGEPGFFSPNKWTEITRGATRVTPDGIWVKGHRVAALQDVVATIERGDVYEVSQEIRVRRPPPPRQPFVGFDPNAEVGAASGLAGGMLTLALCRDRCPSWVYAAGFFAPIVAAAIIKARHTERETDLIYRAP